MDKIERVSGFKAGVVKKKNLKVTAAEQRHDLSDTRKKAL